MPTLTDLICAAGMFCAAVCIIAAACVAQQWRWERRYRVEEERHDEQINTEMMGEGDMEAERLWSKYGDRRRDDAE